MYTNKLLATVLIAMIVMAAYTNAYPAESESESDEVGEFDAREFLEQLFEEGMDKRRKVYVYPFSTKP
jgi:hypothetical protein